MEKLRLENIRKVFGTKEVLHDVSFSVFDKEFFCITGRPGAGKTTLLRIIAGLETPTNGQIYIDGKLVNNVDPSERKVSMFFENLALYPNKTGFENIAFPLRIRKYPEDEIKKRVLEIARLLNIEYLLDRFPRTYSGGEAQRVALARTLIRDAEIYLLDEPLSNIDALLRIQTRTEFKKLQKELGKTFIYATHDPIEALALGNRICIMHEGKALQIDTPEVIYNHPKDIHVALFVGNPPMNLIPSHVVKKKDRFYLECEKLSIDVTQLRPLIENYEGKTILIGIRPEYIKVSKQSIENAVEAKLLSIEYLGDRFVLYFELDGVMLRALGEVGERYSIGETIWVKFNEEKIHLIDKQTGSVLI
jgi:ABC-type sugar transport system ATPase subunit